MVKHMTNPESLRIILNALNQSGYEAYAVGGCVRDTLLGKNPHDWDICTSATPIQVKNIMEKNKIQVFDSGIKHGTVTVLLDGDGYEVTTYRIDGEYKDGRHPECVQYTSSLKEDLARRDFTINAMAFANNGDTIDYFGGKEDLDNRLIRCVGDPKLRFSEDALRILRALRFSSTYGFVIETETEKAIKELYKNIRHVSIERISTELQKLLAGKNRLSILLNYSDIISYIIPEFKDCLGFKQHNKHHIYTVYGHIAYAVGLCESSDIITLTAMLLHDIAKPSCFVYKNGSGHFYGHAEKSAEIANNILLRLKYTTQDRRDIVELVKYHDVDILLTKKSIKKWLNKLGEKQFKRLIDVKIADNRAQNLDISQVRIDMLREVLNLSNEILRDKECFKLKDLQINGLDLIDIGIKQGREIGQILNKLLQMVLEDKIENNREDLIKQAIKLSTTEVNK